MSVMENELQFVFVPDLHVRPGKPACINTDAGLSGRSVRVGRMYLQGVGEQNLDPEFVARLGKCVKHHPRGIGPDEYEFEVELE